MAWKLASTCLYYVSVWRCVCHSTGGFAPASACAVARSFQVSPQIRRSRLSDRLRDRRIEVRAESSSESFAQSVHVHLAN